MSNVAIANKYILDVARSDNPKLTIIDMLGDSLDDVEVLFNMVLVASYIRPEKTGNIIRPDSNIEEDVYQGKAGLVLKAGPNAFDGDEFLGQHVEEGDWIVYKVGDAWSLTLNGVPCRMVKDSSIKLKVKNPNIVF